MGKPCKDIKSNYDLLNPAKLFINTEGSYYVSCGVSLWINDETTLDWLFSLLTKMKNYGACINPLLVLWIFSNV